MVCRTVDLGNGQRAIVCGPKPRARKCSSCGGKAYLLCDWKVGTGTCDAPICARCSVKPAPGKDLCRDHAAAFEQWKAQR